MKKLLVVIDFQNDFVVGSLGFEGAEKLEGPISQKIEEYRANGDEVIFTLDVHPHNYLETQEGKNLPIEHCIEGTEGQELYGRVGQLVRGSDSLFSKPAFGSVGLLDYLGRRQCAADKESVLPFSSIEMVGLVSNICVLSNVVLAKTVCPEVPIILDARCTDSYDKGLHEKALDIMEGLQITVINR